MICHELFKIINHNYKFCLLYFLYNKNAKITMADGTIRNHTHDISVTISGFIISGSVITSFFGSTFGSTIFSGSGLTTGFITGLTYSHDTIYLHTFCIKPCRSCCCYLYRNVPCISQGNRKFC